MTEQMLRAFEREILRRIYGGMQDKGRWRPRWNSEIYYLYKQSNIVKDIKIRRLRWVGHIIKMKGERMQKMILKWKCHNIRQVGKPRIKWEEVFLRDTTQILEYEDRGDELKTVKNGGVF